jgi:hypothetical protein
MDGSSAWWLGEGLKIPQLRNGTHRVVFWHSYVLLPSLCMKRGFLFVYLTFKGQKHARL